VAGYTITITPNDDEAGACTTIRVDTTSGSARITELTVRAAEGGAIFPQQLPALNLDQLIAALVPPTTTAIAATSDPAERADGSARQDESSGQAAAQADGSAADASAVDTDFAVAQVDVPEPVDPPQRAARAGRTTDPKKATRTAPAKKASTRSRQTKAERAAAAAESVNGRRAYRRMPEPGEVLTRYREVGGTTALARHYGVPRHTATGWLRRLRSQGMLEA
jgi:hypothetical protein